MISGVHTIIYSSNPEADRVFLRDVIKLTHVDVGDGWLIFGLPASEIAVHPAQENNLHELYFMCDDINAFISAMEAQKINCTEVSDQGWGLLTQLTLPGGGKLGVYQPRHARPKAMKAAQKKNKKAVKKQEAAKKSGPAKKKKEEKKGKKKNSKKK